MEIGVIVFSRMSSSRLPGKALRPMGDMTLVEWVLRRAESIGIKVVLATSNELDDDKLVQHAESLGFSVFRGSLDNVLERGLLAAEFFGFDYFFRICGDRPFFDLEEMERMLEIISSSKHKGSDLISTHSSNLPKGLTTELVKTSALKRVLEQTNLFDRHFEHMTLYFYENPQSFSIYKYNSEYESDETICLAVDSVEDYQELSTVCELTRDCLIETNNAIKYLKN
jgi:spore coat polysaccharide biosynthesis protein SpsF